MNKTPKYVNPAQFTGKKSAYWVTGATVGFEALTGTQEAVGDP